MSHHILTEKNKLAQELLDFGKDNFCLPFHTGENTERANEKCKEFLKTSSAKPGIALKKFMDENPDKVEMIKNLTAEDFRFDFAGMKDRCQNIPIYLLDIHSPKRNILGEVIEDLSQEYRKGASVSGRLEKSYR